MICRSYGDFNFGVTFFGTQWYTFSNLVLCNQRLQQDLQRETALPMNLDVTMERVLNRDIVVTVNTIVLTAPTSTTVVRKSTIVVRNLLCTVCIQKLTFYKKI